MIAMGAKFDKKRNVIQGKIKITNKEAQWKR